METKPAIAKGTKQPTEETQLYRSKPRKSSQLFHHVKMLGQLYLPVSIT